MSSINNAIDRSNLKSVIEMLPAGLDTRLGSRGSRLSGGEKQRIRRLSVMIVIRITIWSLVERRSYWLSSYNKHVSKLARYRKLHHSGERFLELSYEPS